jgi:hypothetical protein
MSEEKKSSAPTAGGKFKKKWNHHKKCHDNKLPFVRSAKFQGGKEELGGNYFDCTGYGQSDRFMKTVQTIADHTGQEYKGDGITRTEVMTQTAVIIQAPTSTSVISRAQRRLWTVRPRISQIIGKRFSRSCDSSAPNQCMPRSRPTVTTK